MKKIIVTSKEKKIVIANSSEYLVEVTSDSQIIVEYVGDRKLEVKLELLVNDDVKTTIVFLNHSLAKLECEEKYLVGENATLVLAYAELNLNKVKHKTAVHLQGKGAQAKVQSATVCGGEIDYDILCEHEASYTEALMQNYGIVLKKAKCEMVVTGSILKGMRQSKSHQTTRLLTFDEKPNIVCLPILKIDENDVEASHALSLGKPDENQLYYMSSRGLSKEEAIRLIAVGYLMPIIDVIEDEDVRKQLIKEIEQKVQLCEI